jgi:hypothetical protein
MYGFKSSGNFDRCEQCAIAKARQKNVNKNWLGSSNLPGECLYVVISSIKERSICGANFWALIVDDYTYYCWILGYQSGRKLQSWEGNDNGSS